MFDLTHAWGLHTPGWVGYAGAKIYYTQNLQTNRIVSQAIETSLHTGQAAPFVYAGGDVARWAYGAMGHVRVEHWTNAVEQGRNAALNCGALTLDAPRVLAFLRPLGAAQATLTDARELVASHAQGARPPVTSAAEYSGGLAG